MRDSHVSRGNTSFYIFWAILLLLSIIITIIVISSVSPNFKFSFVKLRDFITDSENVTAQVNSDLEEPADSKSEVQASPLNQKSSNVAVQDENFTRIEENLEKLPPDVDFTDISDGISNESEEQKRDLFTHAQFTVSPRFLSRDGRYFLAGSLEVLRQFPRDFQDSDFFVEKYLFDASIPVRIFIEIGWKNLLSFADIDKIFTTPSQKSLLPPVEIPSLEILTIRVSVPSTSFTENNRTTRAVATLVKKSIRAFFDAHDFSADILSDAQQALAVAYVSHGYQDIVLLSSQKE